MRDARGAAHDSAAVRANDPGGPVHHGPVDPIPCADVLRHDGAARRLVRDRHVATLDECLAGGETGPIGASPAIYVYGYLNRIQSSRRLERECQRNLELMWLTGRLAPDFKTIADFRRDSGAGIRAACSRFVELCRQLKLFSQAVVAIDSSKFKAVNSRDRNFTPGKIERRKQQIEQSVQRYLDALETADRTHPEEFQAKTKRLHQKIATLREQVRRLDGIKEQLATEPDGQISLTDPDARSMVSQAKGTGTVGYNVPAAVDAKHHLIVHHEVTNVGSDRAQLAKMATTARDVMGKKKLRAYADRGYYSAPEIKDCADAGIAAYVPKPMTSGAKAEGRFDKSDFVYIAKDDEYRCPAGERAIYRFTREENGLQLRRYWGSPQRTSSTGIRHRASTPLAVEPMMMVSSAECPWLPMTTRSGFVSRA